MGHHTISDLVIHQPILSLGVEQGDTVLWLLTPTKEGLFDFVEDKASSRHHAKIQVGTVAGIASIVDLESRNGTYVNGERIKGVTPLSTGSRIRIGATVYLVTSDDEAETDDVLDTRTQAKEHLALGHQVSHEILRVVQKEGTAATEIAGQLGAFSTVELLQMLIQTNRSGSLNFAVKGGRGTVEIRNGEIVAAGFKELEGLTALRALAVERTGLFWLTETDSDCERTIHQPTTHLLLELCWDLETDSSPETTETTDEDGE